MATGRRGIRGKRIVKSLDQAQGPERSSGTAVKPLKLVSKILGFLAGLTVILASAGYLTAMVLLGTANPVTATLGHSMNPLLYEGDLAVLKAVEPKTIMVGDVIRLRVSDSNQKSLGLPPVILHRVVSIRNSMAGLQFTTKGDNNPMNDSFETRADNVTGVMVAHYSFAGYPIIFIQAPAAPLLGIVIVGLVLVYLLISWMEARMQAAKSKDQLLNGLIEQLPLLQIKIAALTSQLELANIKSTAPETEPGSEPDLRDKESTT